MNFKPLLAAPADLKHVDWNNLWVSPKLDGIRAIVIDGVVMSRSLKPIPNAHVQKLFGAHQIEGYDGELIVGPANAKDVYNTTYRGVMSQEGEPNVVFHVFDNISMPTAQYATRFQSVKQWPGKDIYPVTQHPCGSEVELLELEQRYLQHGYEGVMLRKHSGPQSFYKCGRSTAKEATLLKLKRFEDFEATIVGFEEEMQNLNEATTNALGRTERSSHAENKVGKGRLGALVCKTADGVEFRVGTGFDHGTRSDIWARQGELYGHLVKIKSFPIGVKQAPRFPVFTGLRSQLDTSS